MDDSSFIYNTRAWILVVSLLVAMIACIYVGRKIGLKMFSGNEEVVTGTIVSSMFGLLAFLLAFTFSMSGSRYDVRRKNIVDEANAISSAIVRADLYPENYRKEFRDDFKGYVEQRIEYFYSANISLEAGAVDYSKKLWDRAAQLSRDPDLLIASQQMIPALSEMQNMVTTRLIGEISRVPDSIIWMLFLLSLASAFYLGYSSASKGSMDWMVAVGFCVLTSFVIFITLDLDRPRRGLIQLDTPHKAMLELRKLL
jgi:hypothetical protein